MSVKLDTRGTAYSSQGLGQASDGAPIVVFTSEGPRPGKMLNGVATPNGE